MQQPDNADEARLSKHVADPGFACVKNKNLEGTGNVSGALLRVRTGEAVAPDRDYRICGNIITVKTLDPGAEWLEIKRRLDVSTLCPTG